MVNKHTNLPQVWVVQAISLLVNQRLMDNLMIINLHTVKLATEFGRKYGKLPKFFYSSSACIYHNQTQNPNCAEDSP